MGIALIEGNGRANRYFFTQTKGGQPMFTVITGKEKYKIVDLNNGGESFTNDKIKAYKICSYIQNYLGHNYRLEVREYNNK